MSYTRPSFDDLKARVAVDLAALPAILREPMVSSWARAAHLLHGHIEWVDAQCSPLTCDLERLYDWAALYGVARLEPTYAAGAVLVTGTVGVPVLAGTVWRGTNGLDYTSTEAVTVAADGTRVPVRCSTSGAAGNVADGQALTLVDPIAGVASSAAVMAGGLGGGADIEALADWRIRVADEWQTVVVAGGRSGGRPADYRAWAKSAHASVTGALVQVHALGLGTVLVRPICGTLTNRLPTAAVLTDVLAYLVAHAPAGADVRVAAPGLRPVAITLDLAPGVDSSARRAAIEDALKSLVATEVSETAVLTLAEIDAAVGTVTTQFTRVAPVADIAVSAGEILAPPVVTWA